MLKILISKLYGNLKHTVKSKDIIASNGQQVYDGVKNCTIVWKFKCEDSIDNTHYYKASLLIEDSRNYKGELWEVKKVG